MLNIDHFKKIRVLVIGDLMIDEYLWGNVDRISPEAPVMVVSIEKESQTLGGAGNVINNLVAMGAKVVAIGTAGTGKAGRMIFEKLAELGVETDGIVSEPERPTTRKTRIIASNQQVLRIDREIKKQITCSTLEKLMAVIEKKIAGVDVIIISDYDKGLVTGDLVAKTVALARTRGILILADPKALNFLKYARVSVLTPNKKEAGLAANMEILTEQDLFLAGEKIMHQAGLERLLITCGKDGMVLFEKGRPPHVIASKARQVFDVSGAGDTVISLLGLGLAAGASFHDAAMVANAAAGIVVAKVGTATASLAELRQALEN
ncbi:MAG: D-glycero-beta-D-manno-heptose-7-phosphate kinase [Proteobacteria bacterium]|nr:D-glycero-beta-D-manno-heptose-7-phosphate kinase [Desulfobacula sp.]MBU3952774.1 D-glycero-beta-D-manno-heptose-7-phosphate kinase [Pseudomonadota bacterium]MBU4131901.1 D-glycero-beta-D-manno-heptose-7-phosphate kinase [Pseudomonadota bacterium]